VREWVQGRHRRSLIGAVRFCTTPWPGMPTPVLPTTGCHRPANARTAAHHTSECRIGRVSSFPSPLLCPAAARRRNPPPSQLKTYAFVVALEIISWAAAGFSPEWRHGQRPTLAIARRLVRLVALPLLLCKMAGLEVDKVMASSDIRRRAAELLAAVPDRRSWCRRLTHETAQHLAPWHCQIPDEI